MERKKVLSFLPLGLCFFMLFALNPVMAEPASKIPVVTTQAGITTVPGAHWTTDGGIMQIRDDEGAGIAKLYINSAPPAAPDYTFTYHREYIASVHLGQDIPFPGPWPDAVGIWHVTLIWQYFVNGQVMGTFEGQWEFKSVGWYINPTPHTGPSEGQVVLQGSGIFEGQTLMLDSTAPPLTFTGYLLIH